MDGWRTESSDEQGSIATAESAGTRRGAPRIVADYAVQERIARGPAADTFLATHLPSGRARVLYVLRPAAMHDRALVHRAVCEVDAARWLRHPSVPAVDPCGETPEGRLFIATEHRPGRTLGAVVAEHGQLDVERLLRVAARAVEALDEAHAVGLVHGHLTPASILFGPPDARGRELITLTGLGTAVAAGREVAPGDAPYASPERLAGAEPDARSDVFSLASVLQLALEGAAPGGHDTPKAVPNDTPNGAPAVGADSRTTAGVLALARAADPGARYAGVKPFWEDLLGALVMEAGGAPRTAARSAARTAPALGAMLRTGELNFTDAFVNGFANGFDVVPPSEPAPETTPATRPEAPPRVETAREAGARPPVAPAVPDALSFGGVDMRGVRAGEVRSFSEHRTAEASRAVGDRATVAEGRGRYTPAVERARPGVTGRRAAIGLAAVSLLAAGATALARTADGPAGSAPPIAATSGGALGATTPEPGISMAHEATLPAVVTRANSTPVDGSVPAEAVPVVPNAISVELPQVEVVVPGLARRPVVRPDEFVTSPIAGAPRPASDGGSLPTGGERERDPAALAAARREAQRAVEAFADALEARNMNALRRVAPEMPADERARWVQVFRRAWRVDADLAVTDVRLDGDVIVAAVRSRVDVQLPGASAPVRSDESTVTTLVRDSSGWRMRTAP